MSRIFFGSRPAIGEFPFADSTVTWGHLFLIYEDVAGNAFLIEGQAAIEGLIIGELITLEVSFDIASGGLTALLADQNIGSNILVDISAEFGVSPLELPAIWGAIKDLGYGISDIFDSGSDAAAQYDYDLFEPTPMGSDDQHVVNSNSYVLSILNAFGVDAHSLIESALSAGANGHLFGIPGALEHPTLLGFSQEDRYIAASEDLAPTSEEVTDTGISISLGYHLVGRDGVDDILIGTDYNDTLWLDDAGDSSLAQGGGDFAFGGAGDDRYVIGDGDAGFAVDSSVDIIAVSEGYDIVFGRGGPEDRIVLPTHLMASAAQVAAEPDESSVLFAGNGISGYTSAIALNGGYGSASDGRWELVHREERSEVGIYDEYSIVRLYPGSPGSSIEGPNPDNIPSEPGTGASIGAGTIFSVEYYSLSYMQTSKMEVLSYYTGLGYQFDASSLFIEVSYTDKALERVETFIALTEFQNGDFGIDLRDGEATVSERDGGYLAIPDIVHVPPVVVSVHGEPDPQPPFDPADVDLDGDDNTYEGGDEDSRINGRGGDDNLSGGGGRDKITGGTGNDILDGGADNDRLRGGEGADTLLGGEGRDTAVYSRSGSGVNVSLELGLGSGGSAEGDTLAEVENLVGSDYDDVLSGDANNNKLTGRDGNDVLLGGAGDDRIIGGAGSDTIDGGEGEDWAIYTMTAADLYESSVGTASTAEALEALFDPEVINGVQVDLAAGIASGLIGEGDTLANVENVKGGDLNDLLIGDEQSNKLFGGDGQDQLFGGGGDDFLRGGEGRDNLDGGDGSDWALYQTAAHGIIANLEEGFVREAVLEFDDGELIITSEGGSSSRIDTLTSMENIVGSDFADVITGNEEDNQFRGRGGDDELAGGGGNDDLRGGEGNDMLNGGDGDDRLSGGTGDDILTGGFGSDTFVFREGFGSDIITDFDAEVGDVVNFRNLDLDSFDELRPLMTDTADGVSITVGTDTLVLAGVEVSELQANDFLI